MLVVAQRVLREDKRWVTRTDLVGYDEQLECEDDVLAALLAAEVDRQLR